MTRTCRRPSCDRPAGDAFVCRPCGTLIHRALADASWIVEDLATVLTRQTRYGSGGGRGNSTPLMFDARASDLLVRLDKVISAATKAVRAARPHLEAPDAGVEAHARWLRDQVTALRFVADADTHAEAVLDVFAAAKRAVDRPADRWYAGPCNNELPATDQLDARYCGADLFARVGALVVECRRCSAEYDVAGRRAWLCGAAEEELVDAVTLARAVSWLGASSLTPERIRKWKQRGRLVPAASARCSSCMVRPVVRPCPACRPLYRVGDAIELVVAAAAKAGA